MFSFSSTFQIIICDAWYARPFIYFILHRNQIHFFPFCSFTYTKLFVLPLASVLFGETDATNAKKKRIFHFNFKYDVLLSRPSNEFLHGLKRNHLVFLRKILYLPAVLLLSALSIHNVAYNHVLFEFEEKPNVVCSRIYIMAVIYCVNINAHPPHEQHFLFKQ